MAWYSLILIGAIIGIANIIPGVSGGTMAVVLNVFDKLIFSISNFRKNPKDSIKFLFPILIGAGIGIIVFSYIIKYLLDNYPLQLNFFFNGLIFGSLPLIVKRTGEVKNKIALKTIFFVIALAVMIAFGFVTKDSSNGLIMDINPIIMIIHTFIASVAMILPGISGSLVLVILGSYFTVIKYISDFNVIGLIPVGIGVLLGLIFGSKIIGYLLKNYTEYTFSAILGLMVGSAYALFQKVDFTYDISGIIAVLTLFIGFIIAYLFGKTSKE